MSVATKGLWRIAFFNGTSSATSAKIAADKKFPIGGTNTYEDDDLLATVVDDPASTGKQYTIVHWDAAAYPTGGGFIDMGIGAGDIFRTNFKGDGFGGTTYEDYVIDSVISNQSVRLKTGPSKAITVASKFNALKSLTKPEEAAEYAENAGTYSNRRIFFIWPDVIEDASGVQVPGFYVGAAIAGLISGVVPQQGLTNVAIEGFSDVTRTTDYFGESDLNTLAEAGIWIVTEDPDTGEIYSRHELSTDPTDVNTKELMVTKNVDSISYIFLGQLRQYIGRANVTPRFLTQLRRQIAGTVDFLKSNGTTPRLGGQLIEAEITQLRQHAVNLDQVVVDLDLTIPYPVNIITLNLIV